jgi:hypothetical protein
VSINCLAHVIHVLLVAAIDMAAICNEKHTAVTKATRSDSTSPFTEKRTAVTKVTRSDSTSPFF